MYREKWRELKCLISGIKVKGKQKKNFILDTPVDTFLQSKRNFGERVLSIFLA